MLYFYICLGCSTSFSHKDEGRKFCSRSCSTKYLNDNRIIDDNYRERARRGILKYNQKNNIYPNTKVYCIKCIQCTRMFWTKASGRQTCSKICQNLLCSKTFTGHTRKATTYRGKPTKTFLASQPDYIKPESKKKRRIQIEKNCLICDTVFVTKTGKGERRTCSKDCHYHLLGGKTGHTTHPKHTCKGGKTITLGSSWEKQIAVFLDDQDIEWIRPKSLDYIDESGKLRKYFPDFYLPQYDIYLDPKNSMKIRVDQYKLDYFQDKITLYYGRVNYIKNILVDLLGLEPRPPGNLPAPLRSGV
jgi:hypothetical protein